MYRKEKATHENRKQKKIAHTRAAQWSILKISIQKISLIIYEKRAPFFFWRAMTFFWKKSIIWIPLWPFFDDKSRRGCIITANFFWQKSIYRSWKKNLCCHTKCRKISFFNERYFFIFWRRPAHKINLSVTRNDEWWLFCTQKLFGK